MRRSILLTIVVMSAIFVISYAVLDRGYACPTGQAPVRGADGKELIDANGTPVCSPIDIFNNLFGK